MNYFIHHTGVGLNICNNDDKITITENDTERNKLKNEDLIFLQKIYHITVLS